MSPKPALKIQIDGASRGNPGPSGAGVVLSDSRGKKLKELSIYLGESTNNVAETCALILGLQEALRLGSQKVSVLTDSELLQRQVTGLYRVKDERLRLLHALINPLKESFERFEIQHVPREENRAADRLANKAVTQGLRGQHTLFEV